MELITDFFQVSFSAFKFFCTNPTKVKFEFLRNSSTVSRNTFFTEQLWWLLLSPKQIKRKKKTDTLQIFLSKHNNAKKQR